MDAEGALDPWVAQWLTDNPERATPFEDLSPEMLALARGPVGFPPTRDIAEITDDAVAGIPIRVYRNETSPTGLLVYLHGGGFCIGSIGLMDNVARELAYGSGAVVVSVEYRLAPDHPFPAGLDDCDTVTRWALRNASRFDAAPESVVVGGESAGGNLAAAVALRLRDAPEGRLAAQLLMYPGVAGATSFPSGDEFDGLIINRGAKQKYWAAYAGDRDIDRDPFAAPLHADDLRRLPPALVVLGGCDMLRDEGRAYAARLRDAGVAVEEVCYPGQPHGFLNFGWPAAEAAFERIGTWLRTTLTPSGSQADAAEAP